MIYKSFIKGKIVKKNVLFGASMLAILATAPALADVKEMNIGVGANITGNITPDDYDVVKFDGGSLTGKIIKIYGLEGAPDKILKEVVVTANGGTSIDKTSGYNIFAEQVRFSGDGEFRIKGSIGTDFVTDNDGTGTIYMDGVEIESNIGTEAKKLKSIKVGAGLNNLDDNDVFAGEIKFVEDGYLVVYKNYGVDIKTSVDGQGSLLIGDIEGDSITFDKIGEEGKALKSIFSGSNVVFENAEVYVKDISLFEDKAYIKVANSNIHGSIGQNKSFTISEENVPLKAFNELNFDGNVKIDGDIGQGVAVERISANENSNVAISGDVDFGVVVYLSEGANVTFGGDVTDASGSGDFIIEDSVDVTFGGDVSVFLMKMYGGSHVRIGSNKQRGYFNALSGSTLHVTLTPETTVDKGHVYFGSGDKNTRVSKGVNLVLSSKGTLDKGMVYHIVDSAMSGDSAYVNMPTITDTGLVDYEAYLTKSDDYKGERVAEGEAGSDLFVEITKKSAASVVSDPIAQKTSHVIDEIRSGTPTGDMATVIDVIEHLPDATSVEKTLHDLAPEVSGGAVDGAMAAAAQVGDAVSSRIAKTSLVDMMISSGSTSSTSGVSSGDEAEANYGLWGQVMLASAQQDVRHGQDGYEVKNYGFVFGADRLFGDNMAGGIGLAYINTDVSGRGGSSNNSTIVDSYQLSAYGSYMFDSPWYVEGQAAVSYNDYSGSRYISGLGRTAKADYQGWQVGARAEAGYSMDYKGVKFVPSFGMTMTHLYINNYEEAGAGGVSLVVDAQEYDFASARAGLEVSWNSAEDDNGWAFSPRGKLGFNRSLYADKADVSARFAGGGTMFDAQGLRPEQNSVDIGLGVDLMNSKGLTVSLDGDVLLKEGYQSKTGMIKARFDF
jgi:outer membrane autotransporter protein